MSFARFALGVALAASGLAVGSRARAASAPPLDLYYQPFRVERAALAPDGRHVAFTVRTNRGLELNIFKTSWPDGKVVVPLGPSGTSILGWTSPERVLVVSGGASIILADTKGAVDKPVDLRKPKRSSGSEAEREDAQPDFSRARIVQAADDPAVLLLETTSFGGLPGRERALQVHRLNLLTGELRRLMDYDVESPSVGVTIMDRQGKPRMVHRPMAVIHYYYRTTDEEPSGLAKLATLLTADVGWQAMYNVFPDRANFVFGDDPGLERTVPLGFDTDPNILYFASNLRRDTIGLFAADIRTGKRTEFAVDEPGLDIADLETPWKDPPLVFDRQRRTLVGVRERGVEPRTRWLDPELAAVEQQIERKFPSRRVQLLDWDDTRGRFLALVGGLADPGRYFVFHREDGRCVEFLGVAPTIPARITNPAESFAFTTPEGVRLTGYLTLPRKSPGKGDPPLVVVLHGGPAQQLAPGFDPDAQAIAAMGFAVVKINYRGSTGFGTAHREAIREHLDTVPLDDVLATLDWLRDQRRRIDLRRVGVLGEGYGGYLALRALQLRPEAFQSAVAINGLVTPLDLWASLDTPISASSGSAAPGSSVFGNHPMRVSTFQLVSRQTGLAAISVAAHPELLTKPVFLLHNPSSPESPVEPMEKLRAVLKRQGRSPEWQEISAQFATPGSSERVRTIRKIGEFLNQTLYDFAVKIGEVKEKKD